MDLIFRNCFFVNTNFYIFKCWQFSASSLRRTCALGVRRTPNQTDRDVTCSRSWGQLKITKKNWKTIRVGKNPFIKKKYTHLFYKSAFLVDFEKKQVCVLLKKTQKKHSELLHCIMQCRYFQNYTIITCYIWHSNLRVKKCLPSLLLQSVVGQFTPKWLGKNAHSKQRKSSPTQTLHFQVKFMYMPR